MRNLIKSDLYAQLKQIKVYVYTMLVSFIYIISLIFGNLLEYTGDISALQLLNVALKQQCVMCFVMIVIVTSYYIGKMFSNKFIHMQVIGSGDRSKVLFSKYIIQCITNTFMILLIFVSTVAALNFIYKVEGIQYSEILLRCGLLAILIIRFTSVVISLVFILKNGVASAVVGWIIFVLQILPFLFGTEYGNDRLLKISQLFAVGQIYQNCTKEIISLGDIIWILCTSLIEIFIWFILAKKDFEKAELK